MKVAVFSSRGIEIENLEEYLPEETSEIVFGGAKDINICLRKYALANGIKFTEFPADYKSSVRGAPFNRNIQIIEYADLVIVFWDGHVGEIWLVIEKCISRNKQIRIFKKSKK